MSVSLAAVLIVKNEAARLGACLESLRGVVDDIYVFDTGSSDTTLAIAQDADAVVGRGSWRDDFALARNEALAMSNADWVLSVDADELVVVDRAALDALLAEPPADVFEVHMEIAHDVAPYTARVARLFRPAAARWEGRVHERLVGTTGVLSTATVSPTILRMTHQGYASADDRQTRAQRNIVLAQITIDEHPDDLVAYVDLGRSLIGGGEAQRAADAFEHVRSHRSGGPEWLEATDFLARLVLAEDMPDTALVLTQQLSEAGVRSDYCDWLAAQALVQQHRFAEAASLLRGVGEVVDTSGRVHNAAALAELKHLVDQLAGC